MTTRASQFLHLQTRCVSSLHVHQYFSIVPFTTTQCQLTSVATLCQLTMIGNHNYQHLFSIVFWTTLNALSFYFLYIILRRWAPTTHYMELDFLVVTFSIRTLCSGIHISTHIMYAYRKKKLRA